MDDLLTPTAVLPHLTTRWLGRSYEYFATITSTNDELKARVAQGNAAWPPTGAVLVADYQSAGRGRLDRRWEAEPGTSLMLSALFRPDWPASRLMWLTMMASLAAAEAIETVTAVPVHVKWPNDLVIEVAGVWCKTGGLLLEGNVAENGRLHSIILGLGLNVNMSAAQLPAGRMPVTSLSLAAGQPVARRRLLLELLARLEAHYDNADNGRSPHSAWQKRLMTVGRTVTVVRSGQAELVGLAVGVDDEGQLLVQTGDGQPHKIIAGDVSIH
jgi:BirA family transcriptional regulator, biotin operon repressor / biotin---[acetyl-CoA-carboxylase] ligase